MSFGKSILTLSPPDKVKENGPQSIFKILQDEKLTNLTLLEDNPHSFFDAHSYCKKSKISLQYGINFEIKNSCAEEGDSSLHKLAIFMKNDAGYVPLMGIYSAQQKAKCLDYKMLKELWSPSLLAAVPFYDSFLHKNTLENGTCVPDMSFFEPIFFVEENELPFDHLIKAAVDSYTNGKFKVFGAKSIYYRKRSDIKAYLTYKCICNHGAGKKRLLSSPNFSHFSSDSFCWEAYKEQCRG